MIHHSIWLITCLVTCIQTHLSTFIHPMLFTVNARRPRRRWLFCVASIKPQRDDEHTHTSHIAHHYDIWILDFVSIFIDISMPSNIWRIKAKMLNFYLLVVWWPVHRVCAVQSNGMRVCFLFVSFSIRPLDHISFYYLSIFDVLLFRSVKMLLLLLHHIFMSDINVYIRICLYTIHNIRTDSIRFDVYCIHCIQ